MPTPHIDAPADAFAETCLMPGDPLRAKFVAETWLDDVLQVNTVRNMLAFTGTWRGTPISVMGSGMGIPSISIYAKELITEFGVRRIVRIGSCGTVHPDVRLRDIVIGQGACTDSGVNRARFGGYDFAAIADFALVRAAVDAADARGVAVRVGNLHSADLFYTPEPEMFDRIEALGVLGIEMEAAGLYGVAAEFGASALAICTVSDHIRRDERLTAEERETGFSTMVDLALDTVARPDR